MGASGWVHLDVVKIHKETGKAFLIEVEDVAEKIWIPKSQVSDPEDYEEGDEDLSMSITEYIAREKGIE